jgi:hypothetical protein
MGENEGVDLPVPHWSQWGADARRKRNDCWAACAKMLIAYWRGIEYRTDELAALVAGDGGANFRQLDAILHQKGVDTHQCLFDGYGAVIGELRKGYPAALLWWNQSNPYSLGHCVIVRGFDIERGLLLNDPAFPTGGRVLTWAQFLKVGIGPSGKGHLIVTHGRVTAREKVRVISPLNARKGPGINSASVGLLKAGEWLEVSDAKPGNGYVWRKILDGPAGDYKRRWVAGKWLKDV